MSTTTRKTPWERYGISQKEWENLTPEERRQKRYERWYKRNKKKRNEKRVKKYREDEGHRQSILDKMKERRPERRAALADDKFQEKVEKARERDELYSKLASEGGGRKGLPRRVGVAGRPMWVHTSRKLGLECGRGQSTIRRWLSEGVLPGCTIIIKGIYHFSDDFIDAVREACRLVYYEDGNGSRDVLARLILEQLAAAECSYVPPGGTEKDRVWPS